MLCSRVSGLPLFEPTLYVLSELRATNKASATIAQALRAVMLLCDTLDSLGVDLEHRIAQGRLLDLGEIEELARTCRLPASDALGDASRNVIQASVGSASVGAAQVPLGDRRLVAPQTTFIRLHYITSYLRWRATLQLLKLGQASPLHHALTESQRFVLQALKARSPTTSHARHSTAREGLAPEVRQRLLSVAHPRSPENPWGSSHARARNWLIVRLLYDLGIRRGELLGVRVSDFNFQANELFIARRADAPEDPRRLQPNAKTQARLLPLGDELVRIVREYVLKYRRGVGRARRHDYLLVANGSGDPLSIAALAKVFVSLRCGIPTLPRDLSPHLLRHTWNDNFSELMDSREVSPELETKLRSRLMGWSETSTSAATYTKRHVRRKAAEASLDLQSKLWERESE